MIRENQKLSEVIFLSVKKLILNEANNEVSGIIGISIDITDNYHVINPSIPLIDLLCMLENKAFSTRKLLKLSGRGRGAHIIFRQAQCAYLLCLGKTLSEIAVILRISHRTVEDHIQQLKMKFDCAKK